MKKNEENVKITSGGIMLNLDTILENKIDSSVSKVENEEIKDEEFTIILYSFDLDQISYEARDKIFNRYFK